MSEPSQTLEIIEGSTRRSLVFPIIDANTGDLLDLTGLITSSLLRVFKKDFSSLVFSGACAIPTPANGEIIFTPASGDYDNLGEFFTELEINWADGSVERIHDLELIISTRAPTT